MYQAPRMMLHVWALKFFARGGAGQKEGGSGAERGGVEGRRGSGGGLVGSLTGFPGDAVFVAPDPLTEFLDEE
jgi:hypothetical protein